MSEGSGASRGMGCVLGGHGAVTRAGACEGCMVQHGFHGLFLSVSAESDRKKPADNLEDSRLSVPSWLGKNMACCISFSKSALANVPQAHLVKLLSVTSPLPTCPHLLALHVPTEP